MGYALRQGGYIFVHFGVWVEGLDLVQTSNIGQTTNQPENIVHHQSKSSTDGSAVKVFTKGCPNLQGGTVHLSLERKKSTVASWDFGLALKVASSNKSSLLLV